MSMASSDHEEIEKSSLSAARFLSTLQNLPTFILSFQPSGSTRKYEDFMYYVCVANLHCSELQKKYKQSNKRIPEHRRKYRMERIRKVIKLLWHLILLQNRQ